MGLADLFRPKWKHSNPEVRAEAVKQLGDDQAQLLAIIVRQDRDARVRRIALKRIADAELLYEVAEHDPDEALRDAAAEKADELLLATANGADEARAVEALGRLRSKKLIASVAQKSQLAAVRKRAVAEAARGESGESEKALAEIARKAPDAAVRRLAVEQLRDQNTLREIAISDGNKEVAMTAVGLVHERAALDKIAAKAQSKAVRAAARDKMPPPEKKEESEESQKRARLLELCRDVEHADDPSLVERARAAFGSLAPSEDMRRRFDRACERFYAKRAATAKSVTKIAQKHAETIKEPEPIVAPAKPEGADEIQLQKVLEPDPAELQKQAEREAERQRRDAERKQRDEERARRDAEKAEARAKKEAEEQANLTRLTQLTLELENVTVDDLKRGGEALKRAQEAYDAVGQIPRASLDVKQRWQAARDKLKARVAELREAEDWKRWSNAPKLEQLCVRVEALLEMTDLKEASQQLKQLQAEWKQIGPATKDKQQELWTRFKTAADQVHERGRAHFAVVDEQRGANLAKKEELIARVEKLADSTDWKETAELIKALQEEWKAVGPVPKDKADDSWKRFRAACDAFFDRRKAHFEAGDAERVSNLERQLQLCARVEELAGAADFKRAGDEIKALQQEWKQVGPVPRDKSEETWKRFRGACDKFFERRQQHFAQLDEERAGNLKAKELLCEKVEALADAPDREEAQKLARQISAEWKTIGPAPKDSADQVWSRFRAACDKIFQREPEPTVDPAAESPSLGYAAPKLGDLLKK
jgi:hypothetical protein